MSNTYRQDLDDLPLFTGLVPFEVWGCFSIYCELVQCSVVEGGMRPLGGVVPAVVLDHDCGFEQGMEHLDGENFVAEFAVEGFRECVLPR